MSRNFFSSPNPHHPSNTLPKLLNSGPGSSSYRERDRPIEEKTYDADISGYRTNEGEKEYQKDIKQVAKKNIKDFKNDMWGGRRTRRAKKSRKSRKARKSRRR
jgi:hypothetical protein